ncbi:MAG: phosphoenolpyruvate--protein phosphotransferase [Luminiphilus sp.]|nr:phosphoenolpyruvate--protein phosphotransferase [Luminiphilus sp.]
MIERLRKIVQAVSEADDLEQALSLIVHEVRRAMSTDVCTVYLSDRATNRLVFRANEGLNPGKIGEFSLGREEGLVGWVASRGEMLNLDDASAHPSFQLVPGLGEESFASFMGAPIIHQRDLLGVLVVQQTASRRFSDDEEAFLITISAQLAGIIAHAEVSGLADLNEGSPRGITRIMGVSGSPGIGIGEGVFVSPTADLAAVPYRKAENRKAELRSFRAALSRVRDDIEIVSDNLRDELSPEDHALFGVYLNILDDSTLGGEVASLIKAGQWAQGALSQVLLKHIRHFERMEHSYLRERAVDVRDLGTRVLTYLQDDSKSLREWPEQTILVAEEITASALGEVPRENLVGVVSLRGSGNSHAAIVARGMGVPAVMGASDLPYNRLDSRTLVVDGHNGRVYINPPEEALRRFQQLQDEDVALSQELLVLRDEPSQTLDGHHIPLWVNTGLAADLPRALECGAEGVGLYRTEVAFLLRDKFPSEEDQRQLYREQLEAFAPAPVTMRSLDIGGDKSLPYFPIIEDNPFLGWRGIRVTLDHPEIFLAQIRAMLKANEGLGNLRILLPMISAVEEVEESLALIRRCHDEVLAEGYSQTFPPVGAMIEVPSAVWLTGALARRLDFLSVGSNDLTQYLLAVDRTNARVADMYHGLHPAVLSALAKICADARAASCPVSICGELAGDPRATPLLLAMGFDQLSMNASSLPRVKKVVQSVSVDEARDALARLTELNSVDQVKELLDALIRRRGLERYIRPGQEGSE